MNHGALVNHGAWVNHGDWPNDQSFAAIRGPVPCDSPRSLERNRPLEYNRAVTHTTRGRNRRHKCRERSYYHLHRNLNKLLLHMLILLCIMHY